MKNEFNHLHTRGIGLTAVIVIVAVLAVGGTAGVMVYNQQRASVDTEEAENTEQTTTTPQETAEESNEQSETDRAKAQVRDALLSIRSEIRADLESNASVAVQSIRNARSYLEEVYADADTEMQAELEVIDAALQNAETQIEAESETAVGVVGDAISTVEGYMDMEVESNAQGASEAGIAVEEEGVKQTVREDAEAVDMDDDGDTAPGMDAEASMESDTSMNADGSAIEIESETSAEGSGSLY